VVFFSSAVSQCCVLVEIKRPRRVDVECDVRELCTATSLEDVVVVADRHIDIWKVGHVHSLHTRIGFVFISG